MKQLTKNGPGGKRTMNTLKADTSKTSGKAMILRKHINTRGKEAKGLDFMVNKYRAALKREGIKFTEVKRNEIVVFTWGLWGVLKL